MKAKKWAERLNRGAKTSRFFNRDTARDETVRGNSDVDFDCQADDADDWMIPVDDCDVRY